MDLHKRTILITGGSSGIGRGLAQAFHRIGNQVIVVARHEAALEALCKEHAGMAHYVADVSDLASVRKLAEQVSRDFPHLNALVNNAGIQRPYDYSQDTSPLLEDLRTEVDTNLNGLIWMTAAFLPLLKRNTPASIINVSSGLGYVPLARTPVYSATKAAVNSFSLSLRHQLRESGIEVINLAPPAVETALDQGERARLAAQGQRPPQVMPLEEFTQAAMAALQQGEEDIAVGLADHLRSASRSNPQEAFAQLNP